jgi:hypothetical protein
MKILLLGTFATILLVSMAQQNLAQTTTLYGGVGRGAAQKGAVIIINQTNGLGTPLGSGAADPGVGLTSLAFEISGTLWGVTISAPVFDDPQGVSTLIRIDPVTGVQSALVGTIRLADATSLPITDLAIQPGTDVLFGTNLDINTGINAIYTIDKNTAIATFVGETGVTGATLAFGPDGTLYMTSAVFDEVGFVNGYLHTLDPATGAILTTSDPFFLAHVGGLAVRSTDGVIFASGGMPGDLYTLSSTGTQTFIGLNGIGGVGDIAFTPLPTNKNQCKQGGWSRFNFPYKFKNQGDCVQFVNH